MNSRSPLATFYYVVSGTSFLDQNLKEKNYDKY